MGRRIKYLTIAIVLIIFMVLMYSRCGNTLLEDLVVDVERATGYIININIVGNGSTNPVTDIVVAKGDNSPIPISATAYTDWAFIQWQGSGVVFADSNSANTTVQLTGGDTTITAVFADLTLGIPLMINNNGHGTTDPYGVQFVTIDIPTGTIDVYPDTGYELTLSDWVIETGNATVLGSPNTYTITVTPLPVVTIALADFARIEYTLTVNDDSSGFGTTTPSGGVTVYHGVPRTIIAIPLSKRHGFINWTEESGDAGIGNLNSASTTATLTSGPATVQANFVKYGVYWTTYSNPYMVIRAPFDFSDMTAIAGVSASCTGIDLDIANEHVYYSDHSGKIWRSDLDGGNATYIYSDSGYHYAIALDLVNDKVYFANYSGVWRMNLDGSVLEPFAMGGAYRGVAVDAAGGYVYLASLSAIYRANIATKALSFLFSASGAYEIDLDVAAGQMYWVENSSNGRCGRAFMNGSGGVTYIVPGGLSFPRGIALDKIANNRMYITNQGNKTITVYTLSGTQIGLPHGVSGFPSGIAVDTD